MTFEEAKIIADKVTAKRFWIISTSGGAIHLHECKSEKKYGTWGHKWRFAGWLDTDNYGTKRYHRPIRCSTNGKRWKSFWLASELTRTDWKIQIVSEEVKNLLAQEVNYDLIYKK